MLTPEQIGDKIRQLRVKHNISQEELGRVLGRSHATISDIERGETKLSVKDLTKLADYFRISASEILDETPQSPAGLRFSRARGAFGATAEEWKRIEAADKEFERLARQQAENSGQP